MPTFFDPKNLSVAQRERWDAAMEEYRRIQEQNLDHLLANLTVEQIAKMEAARPGRSIRDQMRDLQSLVATPGNPKSALFARLLDGKQALAYPPPTNHSYPWFEIVEVPGAHPVSIGGAPSLGAEMNGTQGAVGIHYLAINQCIWAVVSMNAAAESLLKLQDQLVDTAAPEKEGSFYFSYVWTPDFLDQVLAAYAAGPEFLVRYGRWAEYRLSLRRREVPINRGHALDMMGEIEKRNVACLSACGSVFQTYHFCLNAELGAVLEKGQHPRDRHAEAKARAAQGDGGFLATLDQMAMDADEARLEDDVAKFEADPARADTVELFEDTWVLEKARLRAPFTDIEVLRLNTWQTRTTGGFEGHPFTCPDRGDGRHGTEGGDLGVLIATTAGWVCPHCGYTQDWAHPEMAEPSATMVVLLGPHGALHGQDIREILGQRLGAYQVLVAAGRPGADVMVESLRRRRSELEEAAGDVAPPFEMWVIYAQPADAPDVPFLARKWLVVHGDPEPKPTLETHKGNSLEEVRESLPAGLTYVPRSDQDDPVVTEIWM